MLRFEGPIVRQNQQLFAGDWMAHGDEDIADLVARTAAAGRAGTSRPR